MTVGSTSGPGVLERFLADTVVDDYASVPIASAPRPPEGPIAVAGRGFWALLAAGLIGLIVVVALLNARFTTEERQQTRAALAERVASLSAEIEARQGAVDAQVATVDTLQERLLAASDNGPATGEQIAALSNLAATTELAGPGVVVTVDDAPDAEAGSLNRVLDRDLQDIVNALWQAGATGVAVNDQRLTGTTAIRAAGEAILVNYQPLTRPYRVSAVGTSTAGSGDSGLEIFLDQLTRDYGLVTQLTTGDVALPAGELRAARFATTASPDETPGLSEQSEQSGAPRP